MPLSSIDIVITYPHPNHCDASSVRIEIIFVLIDAMLKGEFSILAAWLNPKKNLHMSIVEHVYIDSW